MLDEVHPNLFLRNLFTGLSRFIPTLFFGHITAMHRGHFSTMDSNADRIVFKVASTNILCRAITDSFSLTYFDALTKTVLHTCSRTCLHCWVFLNRSRYGGNTCNKKKYFSNEMSSTKDNQSFFSNVVFSIFGNTKFKKCLNYEFNGK